MKNSIIKVVTVLVLSVTASTSSLLGAESNSQQAFIRIIEEQRNGYNAGETELQKTLTRIKRAKRLCDFGSLNVESWVGKVSRVSSDSEGNAGLEVDLGHQTVLKSFGSLFGVGTMETPTSPIYEKLIALRKGDKIRFSGQFIQNKQDCFRELSLTERGSMLEPEFEFDFSEIQR